MECQKITNQLESTSDNPSKFRPRNQVETNDEQQGIYTNSDIKFKSKILKSNLCDYADANIFVKGRITITGVGVDAAERQLDERNKGVTFKNFAPFTKSISRINNTDIDTTENIDIVILMYNLTEYSDNYSKTSGTLWQYYKDDPNDNTEQSESFKSKIRMAGKTPADDNTKDVEIVVPLKYLSNFWRTLEMSLITSVVELIITLCLFFCNRRKQFAVTQTKLYVSVVALSTEDNAKLLQQLKSNFKRKITWNKYESSIKKFAQSRYLNYVINPSFQGVKSLFVLCFQNEDHKKSHSTYYFPNVEIKY